MQLAVNIARRVLHVVRLCLCVPIENPVDSIFFHLDCYATTCKIRLLSGFFILHLNMCMFNLLHPVAQELVSRD